MAQANPLYGSENFSTTLNVGGGINNSQTTGIVLTSVSGLDTSGGILCLDWAAALDTSVAEYIEYGSYSGNTLSGVVRGSEGSSAKAHSNGAVIVAVVSKAHINRLADKLRSVDAVLAQDTSNNEIIKTAFVASAVNEVTVTSAATGNAPSVAATGGDTNIDLNLISKGTGVIKVNGTALGTTSNNGWISDPNTWTYVSADGATGVLTINADVTTVIQAGDRIQLTQTTPKYFLVTKTPTFGAGVTTLTIWGGTGNTLANAAITLPYYSHQKSPFGFNTDPTAWQVEVKDTSLRTQASPVSGTWYNIGTTNCQITIPIGLWNVEYEVCLEADRTSGNIEARVTLSTANNSESDTDLTNYITQNASTEIQLSLYRRKTFSLAAKTIHYLNAQAAVASINGIGFYGSQSTTILRAVSAYL